MEKTQVEWVSVVQPSPDHKDEVKKVVKTRSKKVVPQQGPVVEVKELSVKQVQPVQTQAPVQVVQPVQAVQAVQPVALVGQATLDIRTKLLTNVVRKLDQQLEKLDPELKLLLTLLL